MFAAMAVASLAAEQAIRYQKDALDAARSAFVDAINQTKEDLAQKLGETASDSTIAQHLTWQLDHSVKSTLESHISMGQLDQIVLWTDQGSEAGRARDRDVQRPFEPGKATAVFDRFIWSDARGVPELTLIRPLLGRMGGILVAGSVTFGDTWLQRFPRFKALSQELGLVLSSHSESTSHLATLAKDGTGPALLTTHRTDAWILAGKPPLGMLTLPTTWPFLVLAFVFSALALRKADGRYKDLHKEALEHLDWCANLASACKDTPGARLSLIDAKRMIQRILAEKATAQGHIEEMVHTLKSEIKDQEQELLRRQKQLVVASNYHSIGMQILPLIEPLLEHLGSIESMAQTLESTVSEKLLLASQALNLMMQRWMQDIETRGSRKFVRSLAETEGSSPGQTALDDEVNQLANTSNFIIQVSRETDEALKKLRENTGTLGALGAHWDSARDQSKEQLRALSASAPLIQAQAMILLLAQSNGTSITFVNHEDETDIPPPPLSPHRVWVCALFHLLQALGTGRYEPNSKVTCRIRADRSRGLLVLQGGRVPESIVIGPETHVHPTELIELARTLLSPFAVSVQILPSRDGLVTIAVHWPRAHETHQGGDRAAAGHRPLSQPISGSEESTSTP